ncbi:MAG: hypothetical protein J6W82_05090 [Bacteroidales bacterium]|nr:hypothetical protein [Bacteroidales bacterium]
MPRLPTLSPGNTSRIVTDVFRGYSHNPKIADGEMYDTTNLSTDYYPLLASRKPRGIAKTLSDPGGLIEKDSLCYVDNGTLYVNDLATGLTGLSSGDKQLVSMGAYIVIFPDKKYYNTENSADYGSLEASWTLTGSVTYAPCDVDGNVYENVEVSTVAPDDPTNGTYWINPADGTMQVYSESVGTWTEVATVYTKVSFSSQGQIPTMFQEGDGVEISGLEYDDLNGTKYLYGVGGASGTTDDYIVLIGLVNGSATVSNTVSIQRKLPTLDFVIECQNRLWGCYYGYSNGQVLNEIYCSALGDFRNWRQYQGLSTDSWTASVGSDGQWTGAVNYLGHPTFFKENRIHTVTISAQGAHRIDETVCRGVQKGSGKSLQVVGETLYYKSRTDVCAWQGGFPTGVSAALGDQTFSDAVGGSFGTKYYLSMKDSGSHWHLFVYDTVKGLWLREDNLHALCFAKVRDELWCMSADKKLIAMYGSTGTAETTVSWAMETGILYYEYPDNKYLFRYDIRLNMAQNATAKIYMEYDSSGTWIESGTISRTGTGTVVVPIRPRRCDHLRMKLAGTGSVKIFSVARTLEVGSDV